MSSLGILDRTLHRDLGKKDPTNEYRETEKLYTWRNEAIEREGIPKGRWERNITPVTNIMGAGGGEIKDIEKGDTTPLSAPF